MSKCEEQNKRLRTVRGIHQNILGILVDQCLINYLSCRLFVISYFFSHWYQFLSYKLISKNIKDKEIKNYCFKFYRTSGRHWCSIYTSELLPSQNKFKSTLLQTTVYFFALTSDPVLSLRPFMSNGLKVYLPPILIVFFYVHVRLISKTLIRHKLFRFGATRKSMPTSFPNKMSSFSVESQQCPVNVIVVSVSVLTCDVSICVL